MQSNTIFDIGAVCFGLMIGWIVYRTLRRATGVKVSDVATIVGAIGGSAVLTIFARGDAFGYYAIGLLVGFVAYLVVGLVFDRKATLQWMGGRTRRR